MAVKIRLKRLGRKNRPYYRICVFDARTRRDGTPIEELGSYDPAAQTLSDKVTLNRERAAYWLSVGAQPSETVGSMLRKLGVRKGSVVDPAPSASKAPVVKEKPAPAPEPVAEAAAAEAEAPAEAADEAAADAAAEPAAEAAPAGDAPADAGTDAGETKTAD
ncbi:MAG: 30S ribosomal protein S16 [Planctomycetota bacterium]|jgi:small subunit ribosomal protein S16